MAKASVLFVDDEANILSGLRRSLRGMRGDWTMHFAEGAVQALELMDAGEIDVVVSDMKMPEINGAQFLKQVAGRAPGTVRVVLSGEADLAMTSNASAVSHRFLAKPGRSENVISLIQDIMTLKQEFAPVSPWVAQSPAVGLLPVTAAEQSELARFFSGEYSNADLATRVDACPSFACRVLHLANSAYFGRGPGVADAKAAAEMIGADILSHLFHNQLLVSQEVISDDHHQICSSVTDALLHGSAPLSAEVPLSTVRALYDACGRYVLTRTPGIGGPELASAAVYLAYSLSVLWGVPQACTSGLRNNIGNEKEITG